MSEKKREGIEIPKDHPRYESLKYRHKIIDGMHKLVVAEAGLIAHGRGECFDYILGEKTNETAKKAIEAAVAMLLLAKKPVISVNGNTTALVPDELVKLSKILNAPLEINLFYAKKGRIEAIKKVFEDAGAENLLGTDENLLTEIEGLDSNRRFVQAIADSDLIMVPLEDGDRTQALKRIGKKVIAVDLNPISRTAIWADITIVDNIIRALPEMIKIAEILKSRSKEELEQILSNFNNKKNIQNTLELIIEYIKSQKEDAFNILK